MPAPDAITQNAATKSAATVAPIPRPLPLVLVPVRAAPGPSTAPFESQAWIPAGAPRFAGSGPLPLAVSDRALREARAGNRPLALVPRARPPFAAEMQVCSSLDS